MNLGIPHKTFNGEILNAVDLQKKHKSILFHEELDTFI